MSSAAAPLTAAERAEARRQKILAKGTERMSKVSGLYTKSSGDALESASREVVLGRFQSAPVSLSSSEQEKSLNLVGTSQSASHAAHVPWNDEFSANAAAAKDKQTIPHCDLPSLSNPKLKCDLSPPAFSSTTQRAPGVSAFRADSKLSAAAPNCSRPLPPRFWWTLATWVVAVGFCVGVYAHSVQLLPPAPYVLVLVVVIHRETFAALSI